MRSVPLPFSMVVDALGAPLSIATGMTFPRLFNAVALDSRQVVPGTLFVALKGEVQDGHRYIPAAIQAGAAGIILDRDKLDDAIRALALEASCALFPVASPLAALQACAARWVDAFPSLLRIGITGSAGKTTTKEILGSILSVGRRVVMNEGNYNSETGLPLSVFAIRESHEAGVFELGMNRRDEILELAAVLRPSLALVTNIGSAHIGILGSKEAIAKEKRQIFSNFNRSSVAFIPEDDGFADYLAEGLEGPVVRFGPNSLPAYGGVRDLDASGMSLSWAGEWVRVPLGGEHNVRNILAACAIASHVGVSDGDIRKGLSTLPVLFGRGEVLRGPLTVVQDCYNANPEAVIAAIRWADSIPCEGRRIYVIAGMLELGEHSEEAHRRVGQALAGSAADAILLFGEASRAAVPVLEEAGAASRVLYAEVNFDNLRQKLRSFARPGDLVLLKGSRGMALERLAADLLPQYTESRGEVS